MSLCFLSSNLTPAVSFLKMQNLQHWNYQSLFFATRLFFHFSFWSESKRRRRLVRYFVQVPHLSGSTATHSRILPKRHKLTWFPRNLRVYCIGILIFRIKRHLLYAELNRRWNGAHIFLTCSEVFKVLKFWYSKLDTRHGGNVILYGLLKRPLYAKVSHNSCLAKFNPWELITLKM